MIYILTRTSISSAYPIFAQQGYENQREATGRIVCANCHLANKPVEIESFHKRYFLILYLKQLFRIPYDMQLKQVLANGKRGLANVGLFLFSGGLDGSSRSCFLEMRKEKIGNLSFQSYRPNKKNILVVGPVPGGNRKGQIYPDWQQSNNTVYNATAADPATKKDVHFLKYPIYVGENRGRGQIYPDSSKSNNTVYNATTAELLVSEDESIKFDQPLMSNPNVGGFGQGDAEIVLQDPLRVQGILFFLAS
ncbi:hypothetical protein HAX54_014008, partial [Datura stramonium]|nr:hypothetical protein [Datura stramonium]